MQKPQNAQNMGYYKVLHFSVHRGRMRVVKSPLLCFLPDMFNHQEHHVKTPPSKTQRGEREYYNQTTL